ncbi:MAG: EAL domain-containing protein [Oscillatoriales cyanobacterium SM2_1_8]|nr:EAL domain-containing protein [Oscillatoriales cyanobacterium SM2_1_8]
MQEAAIARGQLEHDLRLAIEREEFLLHYQPIVDLAENRWVGFESLIRWQHPTRGMVPPGDFIELAEQTELIAEMGTLALTMALRQLQDWRDRLPEFGDGFVNVNISPIQCGRGGIDTLVKSLLAEFGVPSRALKLEITESSFIQLESADIAMWQQLANLGVKLCIDDFGTGYSCLSRLQTLPIATLKIDSSFVRGMLADPERLEIVQIIISLAQNLDLTVVAEGIETKAERDQLQAMGCHYGQGYFFAKPLTVEAATTFLQTFPNPIPNPI